MPQINAFPLHVSPRLPPAIARLRDLAENFWFTWNAPCRMLFSRLDEKLWGRTESNPKLFLRCLQQEILDRAAADESFLRAYHSVLEEFDAYRSQPLQGYAAAGIGEQDLIAYFCAEYGLHESFPIYSGGLGMLAGDHCKTASDMRLPFVAVGLLYRRGYFNQQINREGQQIPSYTDIDARSLPLRPARTPGGDPVLVDCPFPGRTVKCRVWQADIGRVPILLLDTDVEHNTPADRNITHVLYGGDRELRLQQEIVLGIGGVRALRAAGFAPRVWHVNEGHAAFLIVERIREHIERGLPFAAALEATRAATVFTTHTPVAAGHDVFPADMVRRYFAEFLPSLGIDEETFLGLGRAGDQAADFNMTRLGMRGSANVNGVSRIHGSVSAELCRDAWPELRPEENPVGYVTNGVHVHTFMREPWLDLLDRYLGSGWRQNLTDPESVRGIANIPDEEFWSTNQLVKRQMLRVVRGRLTRQFTRNGASEAHIHRLLKLVDPENPNVLTIGFARRFATYKRSTLLFTDLEWLEQLVGNGERPLVFLFAGKAHPADEPAQWMMREIHRFASMPQFSGKILLLEGYDAGLSRTLTAGVDVWLNTPVYPFEESGTSGMKAAINGTVNLSVLDGWWAEAYDGGNGWGIPPTQGYSDAAERDRQDAITLYEILQDQVIPLYYDRDPALGYSRRWVELCKRSMASVLPRFNSQRVMHDYARYYYGPAAKEGRALEANDYAAARELAAWKEAVRAAWPGVELRRAGGLVDRVSFDQPLVLDVDVKLNGLAPHDVRVELVLSPLLGTEVPPPPKGLAEADRPQDGPGYIGDRQVWVAGFEPVGFQDDGWCRYRLELRSPWTGRLSYEVRAVPQHRHLAHRYALGLMRWL
ncbi:MAG TPA: alpha-glucan family phosphorylase [Gammaproteobacteria bacterium]